MNRLITLNDGKKIPAIAWGTGSGDIFGNNDEAVKMGTIVLKTGIRHIDTAQLYGTERATGQAIKLSGVKREDIWVTTKLSTSSNTQVTPEDVHRSVQQSVARMGLIPDLFLIHNPWSVDHDKLEALWIILEGLVRDGTLRGSSLGFSNFRPQDIKRIMSVATIKPACHQLEYHPYVLEHLEPVQALHDQYRIVTEAYGPLTPLLRHPGGGGPLKPILEDIAKRRNVDAATVLQLWILQKGAVVVTTSTKEDRVKQLVAMDTMEDLTSEEMRKIEQVGRSVHFRYYKEHMTEDFPPPNLPDGSQ